MSHWIAYRDPKANVSRSKAKKEIKKFQTSRKHYINATAFKLGIAGLVITSMGLLLIFNDALAPGINGNRVYGDALLGKMWFDILQYFTNQSNILMFIYFLLFLTAFKRRIFNSNRFTLYVGAYILIVFVVFWTMLAPAALITEGANIDVFSIVTQGWLHFISPIFYLVFMAFAVKYPKKFVHRQINYVEFISIGMIYPLVYSIYLMAINFVSVPADQAFSTQFLLYALDVDSTFAESHSFISVYGYLTNFNPECYNIIRGITPDEIHTNFPLIVKGNTGSYVKFVFVAASYVGFVFVLWLIGLFNNLSNSSKKIGTKHLNKKPRGK